MSSGSSIPSSDSSRSVSPSRSDAQAASSSTSAFPARSSTPPNVALDRDPLDKDVAKSTPVRPRKPQEFSLADDKDARARRFDRYAQQAFYTEGQSVGPVPMDLLLEELRRIMSGDVGSTLGAVMIQLAEGVSKEEFFKKVPKRSGGEKELYDAIKDSGLCVRLVPMDAHATDLLDHSTGEQFKPDFILVTRNFGGDKSLVNRTALSCTVLIIDVKRHGQDPFGQVSGTKGARKDTEDRREPRGQFGTYGELLFLNGHRTMAVSVAIMLPDTARLILYDRSAAVYSDTFDWRKSGWLEKLLLLLDSPGATLGIDTSVKMISQKSPDALAALEVLQQTSLPDGLEKKDVLPVLPAPEGEPADVVFEECEGDLSMMLILDNTARRFHRIVVHHPFYSDTSGLTGPGTRHFYGIDLDEKTLVHVQEDWRTILPDVMAEAHIYQTLFDLHDASEVEGKHPLSEIPHLPEFLFGSDVAINTLQLYETYLDDEVPESVMENLKYCDSFTHSFAERHPNIRRHKSDYCEQDDDAVEILPRRLSRMVFASIPLSLGKFKSTRQLAQVIRDAVECHARAYEYGILHRNIGNHSIFIDARTGRGMLMRWSQAREHLQSGGPRMKGRITNWYFMSVRLHEDLERTPELRDDLEAFVHVLFYSALRYRPAAEMHKANVLHELRATFEDDAVVGDVGKITGGSGKKKYLAGTGIPYEDILETVSLPQELLFIMEKARSLFRPLYVEQPKPRYRWQPLPQGVLDAWQNAYDAADGLVSTNSDALLAVFDAGLAPADAEVAAQMRWPTADCAEDQCPPARRVVTPFHGSRAPPATAPPAIGGEKRKKKRSSKKQVSREPYSLGSGNISRSSGSLA